MNLQTSYILLTTQKETYSSWAKAEGYNNCEQKESFFYRLFHRA